MDDVNLVDDVKHPAKIQPTASIVSTSMGVGMGSGKRLTHCVQSGFYSCQPQGRLKTRSCPVGKSTTPWFLSTLG